MLIFRGYVQQAWPPQPRRDGTCEVCNRPYHIKVRLPDTWLKDYCHSCQALALYIIRHNSRLGRLRFKRGVEYRIEPKKWYELCQSANWQCTQCGRPTRKLRVNYIVPLDMGGLNAADNIKPVCETCYQPQPKEEADLTPSEAIQFYAFVCKGIFGSPPDEYGLLISGDPENSPKPLPDRTADGLQKAGFSYWAFSADTYDEVTSVQVDLYYEGDLPSDPERDVINRAVLKFIDQALFGTEEG